MQEGKDITLVAFGKLVGYNLKAAEQLKKDGISCEVWLYSSKSESHWACCMTKGKIG